MSRAKEIARSAHALAKAAAEWEAREEQARKDAEAALKLERHRRDYEAALPKLAEWFPGVEWEWSIEGAYGHDTILREKGAPFDDPLKLRVERRIIDMNEVEPSYRSIIEIGDYRPDSSMPGYSYFAGTEVKSPADIGRYLEHVTDAKSDKARKAPGR